MRVRSSQSQKIWVVQEDVEMGPVGHDATHAIFKAQGLYNALYERNLDTHEVVRKQVAL